MGDFDLEDNSTLILIVAVVGVVFLAGGGAMLCKRRSRTPKSPRAEVPTPAVPTQEYQTIDVHPPPNPPPYNYNYNQNQSYPSNASTNTNTSSNPYASLLGPRAAQNGECFSDLVPYRLDESEVLLTRKLSTGAFGVVWLGHYQGHPVAVKRMIDGSADGSLAFAREIRTMAALAHPKIVRFIGCTWTNPSDLSGITEYMDGGDVRSLLENRKVELSWKKEKISIAIDIAEALAYMHSLEPRKIHRDLKSRNVLLNSAMVAKLSDFGLSRNRTYEETLTAGVGTVRWTAPEVMLGENYSEQADVYSFGVVLSELDTREIPFEEKSTSRSGNPGQPDMAIVIKVAKGELRPRFSPECPPVIDQIAKACLQFSPALRPPAQQVLRMLQDAKMQLLSA